jgi:cyanophycin synthetase
VDVVLSDGAAVLNADDARLAEMAELSDGEVIFYSAQAQSDAVAAHRASGGRAVVARDGRLVLCNGLGETSGVQISATLPLGVLLPAVAAAWALGIAPELIAAGIKTFEPDTCVQPA